MSSNGWLAKYIWLLALLILGAYGFAYTNDVRLRGELNVRLDRIESKIDDLKFGRPDRPDAAR